MAAPKPESFVKGNPGAMVMNFALQQAAKRGRKGDDHLGHLTKNDLVIPAERRKGAFENELAALLEKHGINRDRFTVGAKGNSIHPETGLAEFNDGEGTSGGDPGGGGPGGAGGSPGDGSAADSGAGGGGGGAGAGTGSDSSGPSVDTGVGSGTKSATAADETGGYTGVSASDYAGPNPGGQSISGALTGVDLTDLGLGGKIGKVGLGMLPGVGPAIGVLSAVDTAAKHGVDQAGNPGGNLSSGQTGGVGMGLGATTDPGGVGPGNPGGLGGQDSTALGTIFGSPTSLGATPLDILLRNAKMTGVGDNLR